MSREVKQTETRCDHSKQDNRDLYAARVGMKHQARPFPGLNERRFPFDHTTPRNLWAKAQPAGLSETVETSFQRRQSRSASRRKPRRSLNRWAGIGGAGLLANLRPARLVVVRLQAFVDRGRI